MAVKSFLFPTNLITLPFFKSFDVVRSGLTSLPKKPFQHHFSIECQSQRLDTFSFQSIIKDAYDHHAAIYFLLVDKWRDRAGADTKRRRPSTIAEQPRLMPGLEEFQSLRLRTTSESERETARGESSQQCL